MSMTRPLRPAPARILQAPRQIPASSQIPASIHTGLHRSRSVDGAGRSPSAAAPHASPQAAARTTGGRWRRPLLPLLPLMLGALLASTGPVHAVAPPAPDTAPPLIRLAQAAPSTATAAPGPAAEAPTRLPLDDDGLPPNAEAIMRSPRFRHLAHELRCLVCQNQTLLDSHAPLAQDLRHEVVRLMARGMDDAQVRQHLVDRYGEFVLYRPSWSWRNAVLWLGPVLMLLAAALVAWRVLSRRGHALQGASGHVGGDEVGDQAPLASTDARTEVGRAREALRQVDALLDPDHDPDRDKGRRHG